MHTMSEAAVTDCHLATSVYLSVRYVDLFDCTKLSYLNLKMVTWIICLSYTMYFMHRICIWGLITLPFTIWRRLKPVQCTNCHILPCFTVENQPCVFIVMLFRAQNQKFRNKKALNIRKYSSELLCNINNFALSPYFESSLKVRLKVTLKVSISTMF